MMIWHKDNGRRIDESGRYLIERSPHRYRRWTLDVGGRAYGLFGTLKGAQRAAEKLEAKDRENSPSTKAD